MLLVHQPRPVGAGGAEGVMPPPPDFGRLVIPISTKEADCTHHITICPPPSDFKTPTALQP